MKLKYTVLLAIFFATANLASAIEVISPAGVEMEEMEPAAPYQDPPEEEQDSIYVKPDKMPQYRGGMDGLYRYLRENIRYPEKAAKKNIQGKVLVSFVVDKNGKIKQVKLVESVDKALDKEALRVVSNMPRWIPGEKEGKKVNVRFTLPVIFNLDK
jgi:protein TonB